MKNVWILAQEEGQEAPTIIHSEQPTEEGEAMQKIPSDANISQTGREGRRTSGYSTLIFLGLMFVLMYFILFRGPQKQKQQHKKMVQTVEKNDRVRTIGGIIGTIVDIKGDEITLKVDESNNTKIKIVSSAIQKNLSKD